MAKAESAKKNLPANFDDMMRAKALMYKGTLAGISQGQFISFKSGVLTIDGTPVKDNKIQVVLVDFVLENNYFPGKYNPNNTKPPVCYAIGRKKDEMAPHAEAAEAQHQTCEGCEYNEWGSAEEGRGKACKEGARVALVAWDGLNAKTVDATELRYAKIPVTSMQGFAAFTKQIMEVLNKLPFMVVAEMAVIPDAKTQFKVVFSLVQEIKDNALLQGLYTRHEAVSKTIGFGYPKPEEDSQPARGKSKGGKPAGKRKF